MYRYKLKSPGIEFNQWIDIVILLHTGLMKTIYFSLRSANASINMPQVKIERKIWFILGILYRCCWCCCYSWRLINAIEVSAYFAAWPYLCPDGSGDERFHVGLWIRRIILEGTHRNAPAVYFINGLCISVPQRNISLSAGHYKTRKRFRATKYILLNIGKHTTVADDHVNTSASAFICWTD